MGRIVFGEAMQRAEPEMPVASGEGDVMFAIGQAVIGSEVAYQMRSVRIDAIDPAYRTDVDETLAVLRYGTKEQRCKAVALGVINEERMLGVGSVAPEQTFAGDSDPHALFAVDKQVADEALCRGPEAHHFKAAFTKPRHAAFRADPQRAVAGFAKD